MNFRISDTHGSLSNHSGGFGKFDGQGNIPYIIQSAKNTGDVHTLRFFYFIHQRTHIGRHGVHTDTVETAIEHVGLNAHFIEWLCKCTYRWIWIFTVEQIYLFGSTTIGFNTCETTHIDNYRGDFL